MLEGSLLRYYQSGYRKELQTYQEGILNGAARTWDRYSHMIQEMNYVNGKPEGLFQEWYPNRVLKVDGHYKNGMYEGIWMYYDSFGKVTGQGEFINGNGTQKAYYPSGQIKQLTHYKNSIKDGDEIFYAEDGKITQSILYKGGNALNTTALGSPKE